MDLLKKYKEDRLDLLEQVDLIFKAHPDGEGYTKAVDARVKKLQDEVQHLDKKISEIEFKEAEAGRELDRRRSGNPHYTPANRDHADGRKGGGNLLAQLAVGAKMGPGAPGLSDAVKAVTSTSGASALQDPAIIPDLIAELMPSNQLAEAGVQYVDIMNFRQIPKILSRPSHQFQDGEGTEINVDSSLSIGHVKWELKDCACLVTVSNQWLMDAVNGYNLIQDTMRDAINVAIADAVFNGTGANGQPTGIRNMADVQTYSIPSGPATITSWAPLIDASVLLAQTNTDLSKTSLFSSPIGWGMLTGLTAVGGDEQPLLYPPMLPMRVMNPSTLIPENLAGDTETVMIAGDFRQVIVGMGPYVSVQLLESRAHFLETQFLVHVRFDVQCKYQPSLIVIDDILLPT